MYMYICICICIYVYVYVINGNMWLQLQLDQMYGIGKRVRTQACRHTSTSGTLHPRGWKLEVADSSTSSQPQIEIDKMRSTCARVQFLECHDQHHWELWLHRCLEEKLLFKDVEWFASNSCIDWGSALWFLFGFAYQASFNTKASLAQIDWTVVDLWSYAHVMFVWNG